MSGVRFMYFVRRLICKISVAIYFQGKLWDEIERFISKINFSRANNQELGIFNGLLNAVNNLESSRKRCRNK